MTDVSVYSPAEVSMEEYAKMQQESFAQLLDEMGVSNNFMTPAFYRWKYNTPFGPAKLVIAKKEKAMVAATMITPVPLLDGKNEVIAWQNGDTATVPSARKIGLYPRCMKMAARLIDENEIIFGFPNKNSIRGFSYFVKTYKGMVPIIVGVRTPVWHRKNGNITTLSDFTRYGDNIDGLAASPMPFFKKDAAYLNWRYVQHPINQYSCYGYIDGSNQLEGLIVTRKSEIQGKKILLVMELIGRSIGVQRKLLSHAVATERHGMFALSITSKFSRIQAAQLAMVQVPTRFLPKKQVLYLNAKGPKAEAAASKPWALQMGDWDGF